MSTNALSNNYNVLLYLVFHLAIVFDVMAATFGGKMRETRNACHTVIIADSPLVCFRF